jgi:hypothetical protein
MMKSASKLSHMKRAHILKMVLLMTVMAMLASCMEAGAGIGQQRGISPGMVDPGPSGLPRDNKSYLANDAP